MLNVIHSYDNKMTAAKNITEKTAFEASFKLEYKFIYFNEIVMNL